MNFGDLQDFFEAKTKEGVGFAFSSEFVADAIQDLLSAMTASPGVNTDVPMANETRVSFSFEIDPKKFQLDPTFAVSFAVDVWLHPTGKPNDRIVTLNYSVANASLDIDYNQAAGRLYWQAPSNVKTQLGKYTIDDTNLAASGFTLPDGSADEQGFLEQVLYGFIWVTSSNLIDSVFRNIPFPQLENWTVNFAMQTPFETEVSNGYAMVWSETILDTFSNCGTTPQPATPPTSKYITAAGTPGSPQDGNALPFVLFIGATNLVRWKAHGFAPSVTASAGGGAFIKWSIDITVSLQSLTLTLAPAPNGGSLLLHADLGALAFAQAWIDGPCNSQGSLISVTAKGKGTLDGNETVTFTFPPGRIDLDSQETVALDQASLQTAFGGAAWPFDPVKDAILNWAIRSGTINLGASYSEEDKFRLIDLVPSRSWLELGLA
jgi:hypothetical protein